MLSPAKINKLLIIIPAYNEQNTIGQTLQKLKDVLHKNRMDGFTKILVINDMSTDKTVKVAQDNGAKVLTNFQHLGYGGGLQVGYRYAIKNNYDFVIQMDADGQHDPVNVATIYKRLTTPLNLLSEGNLEVSSAVFPDIVLGSRFLKDSVSFKIGPVKKFAISYFNKILKSITGKVLTDPTTGLQGLSRAVIYYYSRFNQFDGKYPDSNILLEAARAGFKIVEIPAIMYAREDGTSMHSGFKPVYYMMHMTISVVSVCLRKDLQKRYKKARQYEAKAKLGLD